MIRNISLKDIDFDLPQEFIAQEPANPKDHSKLMILTPQIKDEIFYNIPKYIPSNTLMVFNDTKVFKARVITKVNGTNIEILFLRCIDKEKNIWKILCNPLQKLIKLKTLNINDFSIDLLDTNDNYEVIIQVNTSLEKLKKYLYKHGQVPLPPYIKNKKITLDQYQSIFALDVGSCAAPTASLHFTKNVLEEIDKKNIEKIFITLHVGLGTFAPIKTDNIYEHKMHEEEVLMSPFDFLQILKAKKENKKILCVGTTSLRAVEGSINFWINWLKKQGLDIQEINNETIDKIIVFLEEYGNKNNDSFYESINFDTNIFITPGYKFVLVDDLITNFHTPKSTLILLVASLIEHKYNIEDGIKYIKEVYEYAKKNNYRFFSFGDAMYIC